MKRFEDILLSLLVLIYLAQTYSRLVDKYPAQLVVPSGEFQIVNGNNSGALKKANIFHRRHLPLTKKLRLESFILLLSQMFITINRYIAYFTTSLEFNIRL